MFNSVVFQGFFLFFFIEKKVRLGFLAMSRRIPETKSGSRSRPKYKKVRFGHGLLKLEDGTHVLSRRVIACRVDF
jgi:hypothetical protein